MKSNKKSSIIEDILNSISPAEERQTDNKMLIAAKISDAMQAKGWKKKDLLEALGRKNQSLITKWLSGTHNFTIDTLSELEVVLEINLLNTNLEETTQHQNTTITNQVQCIFQYQVSVEITHSTPSMYSSSSLGHYNQHTSFQTYAEA